MRYPEPMIKLRQKGHYVNKDIQRILFEVMLVLVLYFRKLVWIPKPGMSFRNTSNLKVLQFEETCEFMTSSQFSVLILSLLCPSFLSN